MKKTDEPVNPNDLFRIKPLEWKRLIHNELHEFHEAVVRGGVYGVERCRTDTKLQWEGWQVYWCAVKGPIRNAEVQSLEAGKQWALNDWLNRLLPALEKVHFCSGCRNEIDPDCCHCGDLIKNHTIYFEHIPVPMGCECGYTGDEPDPSAEIEK